MSKNQPAIPDSQHLSPKAEPGKLNRIDFQSNNFWGYCDNCGQKLAGHKCKFICPACGFFRSCSEP